MNRQELTDILKSQASSIEEDIEKKLEYLNSDEVFSEYTAGLGDDLDDYDDEDDDDEDDDDEDDDDEDDDDEDDDDEDDDDDDDDDEDQEAPKVDPEEEKKRKLAAKIAAMRGLSAPKFLKK